MPCHAKPCQRKFGQLKFVLIKQLGNLLTRPTSEIDWRQSLLPVLAQFAFQESLCVFALGQDASQSLLFSVLLRG